MTETRVKRPEVRLLAVARRIQNEFTEMPGMQLTFEQVRRLGHLSDAECGTVLDHLVDAGVLTRDRNERFRRQERPIQRQDRPSERMPWAARERRSA